MSNAILTYWGDKAIDCVVNNTAMTSPGTVALAGWSGDPRATGVELTTTGAYTRIAAPTWATATSNSAASAADAVWPTVSGPWTTPWNYIVVTDSLTPGAGNNYWSILCNTRTAVAPNVPLNKSGALTLSCPAFFGDVFGNGIINALFGTTLNPPTTPVLVPFFGDPFGSGVELTTGGASRIAIPTFAPSSGMTTLNTSSVNWGSASSDWTNNFDHLALMDNTGGAIWFAVPLSVVQLVIDGDVPTIPIGGLTVSLV